MLHAMLPDLQFVFLAYTEHFNMQNNEVYPEYFFFKLRQLLVICYQLLICKPFFQQFSFYLNAFNVYIGILYKVQHN